MREATDAYVTKIISNDKEQIIVAIEYCNALPAGNNAWQRNGRAIACAEMGIPYFYYADVGGVELDGDRGIKAPRFPNPIVPFSYLTAGTSLQVICIPIYEAHPAITETLRNKFINVFGLEDSIRLIRCLLYETNTADALNVLIAKGTALVKILSNDRKRVDTLRGTQWDDFIENTSGIKKAEWLMQHSKHLVWKKKQSNKVNTTKQFNELIRQVQRLNCLSVGASEIPICLVPYTKLCDFATIVENNYPNQNILIKTLKELRQPIIIVWITGFKPRGDDSRPDRGIVPLARMLFGNDINILTIVSGPAKKETWMIFEKNPKKLAKENGLWEAIINLSNFVFIDSVTSKKGAMFYEVECNLTRNQKPVIFNKATTKDLIYSEHDTDTAIHSIYSNRQKEGVFESMCNPPGGDWSGISVIDFQSNREYRWTSLPRVSSVQAKRPDHVIQILHKNGYIFLAIESKTSSVDLDDEIGTRLTTYIKELFRNYPTAYRKKDENWKSYDKNNAPFSKFTAFSGGAFCFKNDQEMLEALTKGNLDFIMSFEFRPVGQKSILHIKVTEQCQFLIVLTTNLCRQSGAGVEIKIH
ncbi:MAG: hypothetical protein HQL15_09775 [Candidatus Omnitrophica bacterium]|nr:hypothetical protein [Candidatus Omnitrophota bacterium]